MDTDDDDLDKPLNYSNDLQHNADLFNTEA